MKKGRGPDKKPGTRKRRSDAGKARKPATTTMRVPVDKSLLARIKELIKGFKNDKENNKKRHRAF